MEQLFLTSLQTLELFSILLKHFQLVLCQNTLIHVKHILNLWSRLEILINLQPVFYNLYVQNQQDLSKILNKPIKTINSMSHPLGSYNETSLEILRSLDVLLGFRDNMFINNKMKNINNSNLEIAREDHSLIMRKLKK